MSPQSVCFTVCDYTLRGYFDNVKGCCGMPSCLLCFKAQPLVKISLLNLILSKVNRSYPVYVREGHVSGDLLEQLLQKALIYRFQASFLAY